MKKYQYTYMSYLVKVSNAWVVLYEVCSLLEKAKILFVKCHGSTFPSFPIFVFHHFFPTNFPILLQCTLPIKSGIFSLNWFSKKDLLLPRQPRTKHVSHELNFSEIGFSFLTAFVLLK